MKKILLLTGFSISLNLLMAQTPSVKPISSILNDSNPVTSSIQEFHQFKLLGEDGCMSYDLKNSQPTLKDIYKMQYVTKEVAFAVGERGLVLKTRDRGINWEDISTGGFKDIYELDFTDEMNGIIKSNSSFYKTTDGGQTWTETALSNSSSTDDLLFLSENLGFYSSDQDLYRTENRSDWSLIKTFDETIKHIKKFNDNELIVSTAIGIYYSEDNGDTWTTKYSNLSAEIEDLQYLSHDNWYYVSGYLSSIGSVAFISTRDGGLSWDTLKIDQFLYYKPNILFLNESTGFLFGGDEPEIGPSANNPYYVLKTTDGGATWNEMNATTTWNRWDNDMVFIDESTAFLGGRFGSIQKTTDGGENWTFVTSADTYFLTSVIYSDNVGLVGGEGGSLFRTTDNGLSWNRKESNTDFWVWDFAWVGSKVFAVSSIWGTNDCDVIVSEDNGETWTKLFSPSGDFRVVNFFDDLNGIIAGMQGKYFVTTDGGLNWTESVFSDNPNIKISSFPSENVGYLVASEYLLKTVDSGTSWSPINTTDIGDSYSSYFLNEDIGYIGGDYGKIFRTIDGGVSFDTLYVNSNPEIFSIHFFDENRGYVATSWDVQYTINGGVSWTRLSLPDNDEFRDIHFIDDQHMTVVGRGGAIYDVLVGEPTTELIMNGFNEGCIEETQTFSIESIPYEGEYQYNWSLSSGGSIVGNGNAASVIWSDTGTFTVSVFASNSCGQGPITSFEISIDEIPSKPVVSFEDEAVNSDLVRCINDGVQSFTITDYNSELTYQWVVSEGNTIENQDAQANITWGIIGSQEVTLTAANQCGASEQAAFNVIVSQPDTDLVVSLSGTDLVLTGATGTIQWYLDGSPLNESSNLDQHIPATNGTYKASSTNVCGEFFSNEVVIDFILGVKSLHPALIYPNPTNGILKIANFDRIDELSILDLSGRVWSFNLSSQGTIDVSGLKSGSYFLLLNINGSQETFRFVKE